MLIESVLLAAIIIFCSGKGRGYLERINIKWLFLPFAAFALEALPQMAVDSQWFMGNTYVLQLFQAPFWLESLVYSMLICFFIKNHALSGWKLILLGISLNTLVVLLNGGFMPVGTEAMKTAGFLASANLLEKGLIFAHQPLTEVTALPFLADVIHIWPPYPFPKSTSLGDWIMSLGILYHGVYYSFRTKEALL